MVEQAVALGFSELLRDPPFWRDYGRDSPQNPVEELQGLMGGICCSVLFGLLGLLGSYWIAFEPNRYILLHRGYSTAELSTQ